MKHREYVNHNRLELQNNFFNWSLREDKIDTRYEIIYNKLLNYKIFNIQMFQCYFLKLFFFIFGYNIDFTLYYNTLKQLIIKI